MGLIGQVLQPLYAGFPCVIMSPVAFLQKPVRWLQAISRYRATISGAPNFAYELCVEKVTPEQQEGARPEPLAARLQRRRADPRRDPGAVRRRLRPVRLPARAVLPVLRPGRGDPDRLRRQLRGRPRRPGLPRRGPGAGPGRAPWRPATRERAALWARVASCRSSGWPSSIPRPATELPAGQVGEIWVSGGSVAQGYWGSQEETEHTFRRTAGRTAKGRSCAPATSASSRTASCSSPAASRT